MYYHIVQLYKNSRTSSLGATLYNNTRQELLRNKPLYQLLNAIRDINTEQLTNIICNSDLTNDENELLKKCHAITTLVNTNSKIVNELMRMAIANENPELLLPLLHSPTIQNQNSSSSTQLSQSIIPQNRVSTIVLEAFEELSRFNSPSTNFNFQPSNLTDLLHAGYQNPETPSATLSPSSAFLSTTLSVGNIADILLARGVTDSSGRMTTSSQTESLPQLPAMNLQAAFNLLSANVVPSLSTNIASAVHTISPIGSVSLFQTHAQRMENPLQTSNTSIDISQQTNSTFVGAQQSSAPTLIDYPVGTALQFEPDDYDLYSDVTLGETPMDLLLNGTEVAGSILVIEMD